MSLICHECGIDIQPSDYLSGREGVLIYPNVQALIYVPPKGENEKVDYESSNLESKIWISLCFECIENKMLEDRKEKILKPIYGCYEAEIDFRRIEEDQKGRWCDGKDMKEQMNAYHEFEIKYDGLDKGCIYCGNDFLKEKKPFFIARTIDKIESMKTTTLFGSYSWSTVENGMTRFGICFDDFMEKFPLTFKQLSYNLLGKRNPNIKRGKSELHISPEFEDAFEEQTGKSIDDEIKEGKLKELKDKGIEIIRHPQFRKNKKPDTN